MQSHPAKYIMININKFFSHKNKEEKKCMTKVIQTATNSSLTCMYDHVESCRKYFE